MNQKLLSPIIISKVIKFVFWRGDRMRLIREENPNEIEKYSNIKPAPTFGPLRCYARCPGTMRTCTLSKNHIGPHVAHGMFKKVMAVWDEE